MKWLIKLLRWLTRDEPPTVVRPRIDAATVNIDMLRENRRLADLVGSLNKRMDWLDRANHSKLGEAVSAETEACIKVAEALGALDVALALRSRNLANRPTRKL